MVNSRNCKTFQMTERLGDRRIRTSDARSSFCAIVLSILVGHSLCLHDYFRLAMKHPYFMAPV